MQAPFDMLDFGRDLVADRFNKQGGGVGVWWDRLTNMLIVDLTIRDRPATTTLTLTLHEIRFKRIDRYEALRMVNKAIERYRKGNGVGMPDGQQGLIEFIGEAT